MKKNRGIMAISFAAIIFIFMLIYKQSWITKLLYEQQQLINRKVELQKECEVLNTQLYQLQDPHCIYQYAHETLNLQPIAIIQAKSIKQSIALQEPL